MLKWKKEITCGIEKNKNLGEKRWRYDKNANLILVIEDKKIVEMGNHEELMEKQGHYFKLYKSKEEVMIH